MTSVAQVSERISLCSFPLKLLIGLFACLECQRENTELMQNCSVFIMKQCKLNKKLVCFLAASVVKPQTLHLVNDVDLGLQHHLITFQLTSEKYMTGMCSLGL